MAERTYFDRFPSFVPDPQATLLDNFGRLAITQGWQENTPKYTKNRNTYVAALAKIHIGGSVIIEHGGAAAEEKLARFQDLCRELGVTRIPTSITQCKKRLGTVHVCIVDLIDSRRLGTRVRVFRSQRELQEHVRSEGHFFPKQKAKKDAGGLLKLLLRTINE